jgi:hypothetical protein
MPEGGLARTSPYAASCKGHLSEQCLTVAALRAHRKVLHRISKYECDGRSCYGAERSRPPRDGVRHGRTYYEERRLSALTFALRAQLALARRDRDRAYRDLTLGEVAADHLYVSFNSVSSHAHRLYRRLGVRTRAETVAATRERGSAVMPELPSRP